MESKSIICVRFFKNLVNSCILDLVFNVVFYYNFIVLKVGVFFFFIVVIVDLKLICFLLLGCGKSIELEVRMFKSYIKGRGFGNFIIWRKMKELGLYS